jgi:hypothetical protein
MELQQRPAATRLPAIVKADGSREAFSPERLRVSLMRAGAGPHAAERITDAITRTIAPNSSSREIYSRAFALLRKEARPVAARYALRRALLDLGPTGHPFEDFISHLYTKEGWSVETRKMITGKCVVHEVDFYASHPGKGEYMAAELKYHNDPGYKSDLKTVLYVKSRFDDIFQCDPATRSCPIDRGILVTNTKFTTEVIKYAECAGVELLGWDYPTGQGLFDRMSRAHVYPVTTLTTLARSEKRLLVDAGIVTVDQLQGARDMLRTMHMESARIGEIFTEAQTLLDMPHIELENV